MVIRSGGARGGPAGALAPPMSFYNTNAFVLKASLDMMFRQN